MYFRIKRQFRFQLLLKGWNCFSGQISSRKESFGPLATVVIFECCWIPQENKRKRFSFLGTVFENVQELWVETRGTSIVRKKCDLLLARKRNKYKFSIAPGIGTLRKCVRTTCSFTMGLKYCFQTFLIFILLSH